MAGDLEKIKIVPGLADLARVSQRLDRDMQDFGDPVELHGPETKALDTLYDGC